MSKPIVGIVAKHMKLEKYARPERPYSMIYDEVRKALIDHGAVPIGFLSPSHKIRRNKDHTQDFVSAAEIELIDAQLALC